MDWKLLLEYIKVFLWPIVVLTLGLVFRKQLAGLARNIDSVETPIGGVTFQRQAEVIAQEAAEIEGEMAAEISEPTRQSESREIEGEADGVAPVFMPPQTSHGISALLVLAQSDPTAAVLRAWRDLEAALTDVAAPFAANRRSPGAMIKKAELQGYLPGNLARVANDLRELRNRVVHEGDVSLTAEGAATYVTATQSVLEALTLARTPRARAVRYDHAVKRAVVDLGFNVQEVEMERGFDFLVHIDGKTIGVVAKYTGHPHFMGSDLRRLVGRYPAASVVPALIVTNSSLSGPVSEFNSGGSATADTCIAEVAQWRDGQDDDLLMGALQRLAAAA
ncbi:hypothetical protein ACFWXE_26055 [[Kitasatospora] papulosa]|uniref:hypothetical protein n=1 Tax=[Kitasatospora] papulosa TaxID=1464011 RepID=UPI00368696B6